MTLSLSRLAPPGHSRKIYFIDWYGEAREKLTQDDVDDILQLMRIRAELRKDKEEKEQRRKENDT